MGIAMPAPILIGSTYYLKIRVPADLKLMAKDRSFTFDIDGRPKTVKIGEFAKVSLETGDRQKAKERFTVAHASLVSFWDALRNGLPRLTFKQSVAVAGEIRDSFLAAFDEEPATPELWERVATANRAAASGRLSSLRIDTTHNIKSDMEARFGPLADLWIAKKGVEVLEKDRPRLLAVIAEALTNMAEVNRAKAMGDYSQSDAASKYPKFEPSPVRAPDQAPPQASHGQSFAEVIDNEASRRAKGRDAAPLRDKSKKKYEIAVEEFTAFRGSNSVETVTAEEADAWVNHLIEAQELSNNTIKQRLQNLKTVVEWARQQNLGKLFPAGNPLSLVRPPDYQSVPSHERTFTMQEARTVLQAARKETAPELRWCPWLCAYSGARINEVAQLSASSFFKLGDDWFYKLTTMGGKTLKTLSSERRVPVHPDLIAEGLIEFVQSRTDQAARLFPPRTQPNISEWLRGGLKITRGELAPNHGWRHLFEDMCVASGVSDAAREYITGRASGKSAAGYGKSEVMLPGLANEMRKVMTLLPSPIPSA